MNRRRVIPLTFFLCLLFIGNNAVAQAGHGKLLISFQHIANGKPLVLRDSSYTNAFNENYQVTRLKYYISNIHMDGRSEAVNKQVFLIDASATDTLSLELPEGTYQTLSFTLGVDSLLNCSGAQDGALDPLNGMFWTWNTGYIFFKLEGYSSSSTADLNRIEQHIGGYRGPYKAQRVITLRLDKPLSLAQNGVQQLDVQLNLDKYWLSVHPVKLAENPLVMIPGALASRAADNAVAMFSIKPAQ